MISELARVVVGVPVSLLAVLSFPSLLRRRALAVLVGGLAVVGFVWPLLPSPRGWVILAAGLIVCACLIRSETTDEIITRPVPARAIGLAGLAVVLALVVGASDSRHAVRDVLENDDAWFVMAMALAAVPVGGRVVAWILRPYAEQIESARPSLVAAGRLIGWLERSLLFALLVAGQPEAAGLALAAKTVARFPQLQNGDEALAEYILVGTLASIVVAGGSAVIVRAALGLSVL